jgi:hypothetical protein
MPHSSRLFRCIPLILGALVAAFAGLAVYGTWLNYTPVPFWDMWNGQLLFNFRVEAGEGWPAWWELHNEHRLVIPKAIFWLDGQLFNNSLTLLFSLNVALATCNFACFAWLATRLLPGDQNRAARYLLVGVLGALCFSWLQVDNFLWAFQSQFFLSYLLPLISFILLAQYSHRRQALFFWAAATLGILSAGTMANGLLASVVLVPLAVALRLGWTHVGILTAVAALVWQMYFSSPTEVISSPSLGTLIQTQPMLLLEYLLTYLGGPWFFMLGSESLLPAQIAGAVLIAGCIFLTWKTWQASSSPLQWALLGFLLFIGGTALGTASGRLAIGLEQSLSSRYLTPQLLAWAALITLAASHVKSTRWSLAPLALIPLLLLPYQLNAATVLPQTFNRLVAALALQMGAKDEEYFAQVYFDLEKLQHIAAMAKERETSVFAYPLIADAEHWFGQKPSLPDTPVCQGNLDITTPLKGSAMPRVQGWIFETSSQTAPRQVLLLAENGEVIGFALSGQPRPDTRHFTDEAFSSTGYVGYVRADRKVAAMAGRSPECYLRLP